MIISISEAERIFRGGQDSDDFVAQIIIRSERNSLVHTLKSIVRSRGPEFLRYSWPFDQCYRFQSHDSSGVSYDQFCKDNDLEPVYIPKVWELILKDELRDEILHNFEKDRRLKEIFSKMTEGMKCINPGRKIVLPISGVV